MNNRKGKKRPFYTSAFILLSTIFVMSTVFFALGCEEIPSVDTPNGTDSGISQDSEFKDSQPQEEVSDQASGEEINTEETSEQSPEETSENEENAEEQSGEETNQKDTEGMVTVEVFYTDSDGQYLVGEKRLVGSDNKFVNAMLELLKPPKDDSLIPLVPVSTVINKVVVRDNIADVDLSADFIDDRFVSETVDILLVYSIVNTLTGFSEIDAVIFYINGEKLKNLGSLDVDGPLFRNNDLIKE